MRKTALAVALSLSAAGARAAVVAQAPLGQESLEKVSDLAQAAQTSASLENAGRSLSRGFDASGRAPVVAAADATAPAPAGLEQAPPEQGIHYATIPQPDASKITPDQEKPDTKADDAKKKKELQRAAIGGIGGAAVLAVFGFIFGGPVGALVGAGLGFALLAGVTYMNNNPI